MDRNLSARELVNQKLGKKLSPKGQALIDYLGTKTDPPNALDPQAQAELDRLNAALAKNHQPPLHSPASRGGDQPTNSQHSTPCHPSDRVVAPTGPHNPAGHGGDQPNASTLTPEPKEAPTQNAKNKTPQSRRDDLLELINKKLTEAQSNPQHPTQSRVRKRPVATQSTRAEINRANAAYSTGPRTPEGKSKASANSLKHGFYANVDSLNPHDSPLFLDTYNNLRMGLQPDGPAEEHLIRELSMLSARLQRLESAEYALIASGIESNPKDTRELATSYINNNDAHLEQLRKAELHLRRAYNRTFDRLERMQRDRFKLTPQEAHKRSERWINTCKLTGKCPTCNPPDDFPSTPTTPEPLYPGPSSDPDPIRNSKSPELEPGDPSKKGEND